MIKKNLKTNLRLQIKCIENYCNSIWNEWETKRDNYITFFIFIGLSNMTDYVALIITQTFDTRKWNHYKSFE